MDYYDYHAVDVSTPVMIVPMLQQLDSRVVHAHAFREIVIVLGGSATHWLPHESATVRAGDVLAIPPHVPHCYRGTRDFSIINILCHDPLTCWQERLDWQPLACAGLLESDAQTVTAGGQCRIESSALREWRGRWIYAHARQQHALPGWRYASRVLFEQLCLALDEDEPATGNTGLFQEILDYIEAVLADGLQVAELAQWAGMSPDSLQRRFRSELNTTPSAYLRRCRIERARSFLLDTDWSIARIAQAVGIDDANYFSRVFSAGTGYAPRHFRQAHQPSAASRVDS